MTPQEEAVADAFAQVKRLMNRGERVGDIHPGAPIALQGVFSGPELEAIMTLMAASEVRVTRARS